MTSAAQSRVAEVLLIDPFVRLDSLRPLLDPVVLVRAGDPEDADESTTVVVTADRPIVAEQLRGAPNLQLVITASVGYDHVDVDGLRRRGIEVCHAPSYCTQAVGDHAIAAVLSLVRGLHRFDHEVKARRWETAMGGPVRAIRDTTLGLVGFGRIGRGVAQRAIALGMRVIATDTRPSVGEIPAGVRLTPLEEVLAESDVVSLHAPSGRGAGPLLGVRELALMRPDALLVNTARAALVDLDALADRLRDGRLAAAHFDVWETEPPDWEDPRLAAPNLFLSPHIGWMSPDSEPALWREVARAITLALAGEEPPHRVDVTR